MLVVMDPESRETMISGIHLEMMQLRTMKIVASLTAKAMTRGDDRCLDMDLYVIELLNADFSGSTSSRYSLRIV